MRDQKKEEDEEVKEEGGRGVGRSKRIEKQGADGKSKRRRSRGGDRSKIRQR